MKQSLSALLAGILFGLGLVVSDMINPKRVQDFLDVTGNWDPTLAFVMISALMVTTIGYKLVFARGKPLYSATFSVPENRNIDIRLVLGAVLFGVGWGLSGFCPGPAIVGLSTLDLDVIVFVFAMLLGMKAFEWFENIKK